MRYFLVLMVTALVMSSCFGVTGEVESKPEAVLSKLGPSHTWIESNSDTDFIKSLTQITIDDIIIGTGFFITPTMAITNAHVALNFKYCRENEVLKCKRFSLKNPSWGEILISATDIQIFNDMDLAIIIIKKNSPLAEHEFRFDVEHNLDVNHPLTLYSFSDSKIIEVNCEISGGNLDRKIRPSFFHTCDTVPSFSGSPIISRNSHKIIGLHWGASKSNDYNQAIPMPLIEERILSVLY